MCGNFGLLSLGAATKTSPKDGLQSSITDHLDQIIDQDDLDVSLNESMHQVSKLQGMRFRAEEEGNAENDGADKMKVLSPVKILEAQTACTEIRGGQAGGFSSIEYKYVQPQYQSRFDAMFQPQLVAVPTNIRVRMVARKRHPLAADLSALYMKKRGGKHPDPNATITVIGHTRFATSSINQVSELHPHAWVPFHEESVWLFNSTAGRFEKNITSVGLHISHNGDFDAMEAYSQTMVVDEIGFWLERVLHVANHTKGDSPKVAGCMDLMRVQGRWAAAARLAYIRCIYSSNTDTSNGEQLNKTAPNSVPSQVYWQIWAEEVFEKIWSSNINNLIKVNAPNKIDVVTNTHNKTKYTYQIDSIGVKFFIELVMKFLQPSSSAMISASLTSADQPAAALAAVSASGGDNTVDNTLLINKLDIAGWSSTKLYSFLHHAVRGFLYADLYSVMTELLSRAEGSFGLQAHCSLEPGVVVIASKGQPMSIAFDPSRPIVLFASEAEALAVPVYENGAWLSTRLDLDAKGEIFRIGEPKALQEGKFTDSVRAVAKKSSSRHRQHKSSSSSSSSRSRSPKKKLLSLVPTELPYLLLDCGIEIRCYSLTSCIEKKLGILLERCVKITSAPIPFDPKADLVGNDLKVTPAVLNAIDHAWSHPSTIEMITGQAFAEALIKSMQERVMNNEDVTDLLIGGVEVSLWMAEQFAADLRRVFPNCNITTISANKLLGVGGNEEYANPTKVFFPGAEEILPRRIGPNTCILLISQSGQTFPTLHATRKLAKLTNKSAEKLWIVTGCFNSKMEQALVESYQEAGLVYGRNRVFNNYSGHRPAEPSTVAVAATWHTLTRLLLHVIDVSRMKCPSGRLIHPWDYDAFAMIVTRFIKYAGEKWKEQQRKQQQQQVQQKQQKQQQLLMFTDAVSTETAGTSASAAVTALVEVAESKVEMEKEKAQEEDPTTTEGGRGVAEEKKTTAVVRITEPLSPPSPVLANGSHNQVRLPTNMTSSPAARSLLRGTSMKDMHNLMLSTAKMRAASSKQYKISTGGGGGGGGKGKYQVVMTLSDGCMLDLKNLISQNLIPNISQIVGYDRFGNQTTLPDQQQAKQQQQKALMLTTHQALVQQGQAWAYHIQEPWMVLVLVAIYIFFSVGLELPIFGLLGDLVLKIVRSAAGSEENGNGTGISPSGTLEFTPRIPFVITNNPIGFTLLGLFLQICDAFFFIFIAKNFTYLIRLFTGRPLAARHGKRTLVIVYNACVHQLVEIFVSKLFSQAYSICSIDVHGASGLDHFVHRFTHRVVRGVLIAVGRPDGRLGCLAKSEASVLLATKQAAFIRNPDYASWGDGNGPEIVTIGHNPFQPNVGFAKHIVLHNGQHNMQTISQHQHAASVGMSSHSKHGTSAYALLATSSATATQQQAQSSIVAAAAGQNRNKFVDEYLYDRLFLAKKPFTTSILRSLRQTLDTGHGIVHSNIAAAANSNHNNSSHHHHSSSPRHLQPYHLGASQQAIMVNHQSVHSLSNHSKHIKPNSSHQQHSSHGRSPRSLHSPRHHHRSHHGGSSAASGVPDEPLPYGVHHIDPSILYSSTSIESSVFADFVMANKEFLTKKIISPEAASTQPASTANAASKISQLKLQSNDPAVRLAFSSKLDKQTRQIQDLQVIVQQLYECRIASLERYLAFCVMFHAMAKQCSTPWLLTPWDIARSQSNLRVATTASPISAGGGGGGEGHETSAEIKKLVKMIAFKLRKIQVNF